MNQYRAHLKTTRKSGAPGVFEVMARGFTAKFGSLKVRDLKPHHIVRLAGETGQLEQYQQVHVGTLILGAVSWHARKASSRTIPSVAALTCPNRSCTAAKPECRTN